MPDPRPATDVVMLAPHRTDRIVIRVFRTLACACAGPQTAWVIDAQGHADCWQHGQRAVLREVSGASR